MRNSFINELLNQAKYNKKIFLITADIGFSVIEPFANKYPKRFLNAGISEQNMVLAAAGLASEGYNVFIYSIGNFPILRCLEQIRNYVCYSSANVKIISTGAGYAYGPLGVSHHTTEDISILRSLPNIQIISPSDPLESKAAAAYLSKMSGPAYLRLSKSGDPIIHQKKISFKNKNPFCIKRQPNSNIAILVTGNILKRVIEESCEYKNVDIFSFPFIKPIPKKIVIDIYQKYKYIITVEEHQLAGGFSSSLLEIYNDENIYSMKKNKIFRIGIKDKFCSYAGSQDYLIKKNNLSVKNVLKLLV